MENRFVDCKSIVAMVVRRDKVAAKIDAEAINQNPQDVAANRRRLNAEYANQMRVLFGQASLN